MRAYQEFVASRPGPPATGRSAIERSVGGRLIGPIEVSRKRGEPLAFAVLSV